MEHKGIEQPKHIHVNRDNLPVVPLGDAGTEPYTMMIKFEHTVITCVTVARPRRPKYETCLAEFKLEHHWGVRLQNLLKDHFDAFT